MTTNDDDIIGSFDDAPGGDDLVMDDLEQKSTLGDLWRNNPMVKVAVVLGALAIVVGAMVLFGGEAPEAQQSLVASGSDVKQTPGTDGASQAYVEAVEEQNNQGLETALQTDGSFFPTPVPAASGSLLPPDAQSGQDDPLAAWRQQQEQQQVALPPDPAVEAAKRDAELARQQALNTLANAMTAQMQQIIETRQPGRIESMTITNTEQLGGIAGQLPPGAVDASGAFAQNAFGQNGLIPNGFGGFIPANAQQQAALQQTIKVLLNAGTIEYGQLLLESNTDAPGPVLAQIVTGPFAGGRVIGTFTNTDNYLVLNFNTLVKDNVNYPIDAVAVDPETTLPGVVTEIDRRYFQRIVLPAAARFIEGIGSAIAESGSSTTVTVGGDVSVQEDNNDIDTRQELFNGVEEGANELSDFLSEEGDRIEPLIRVKAGTPVGIFFTQPVTQTLDANGEVVQQGFPQAGANQQQQQQGFFPGFVPFGANGQQQQQQGFFPGGTTGLNPTNFNTGFNANFSGNSQFPAVPTTPTTNGTSGTNTP